MLMKRQWIAAVAAGMSGFAMAAAVIESERAIPVCQEVDVVVVGGTCGAVAAAEAAAKAGAKVFLSAPRPYLGDDVAGTLRLWLEEGEVPASPLAKALFVQAETSLPFTYQTDKPSCATGAPTMFSMTRSSLMAMSRLWPISAVRRPSQASTWPRSSGRATSRPPRFTCR